MAVRLPRSSSPVRHSLNFNRLDGWQRVAQLEQIFWSGWKEKYLTLLQLSSKWLKPKPGLIVDDLVVVKDENTPPKKWPLARVAELWRRWRRRSLLVNLNYHN